MIRILTLAVVLVPVALYGSSDTPVAPTLVSGQPGCPVQIVSASSDDQRLFKTIQVRNNSTMSVSEVTVAAWLAPGRVTQPHVSAQVAEIAADRAKGKGALVRQVVLKITLEPGQRVSVNLTEFDRGSIQSLANAMGATTELTLGVTKVMRADGSKWTYDPVANSGF
jgi:hypothetical protein